jgi:hypothetical protein
VAIKIENRRKSGQLAAEYEMCKLLDPKQGFAAPKYYGVSGEYRIMVMQLLGASLEACFQECNNTFSLKTILMIGEQVSLLPCLNRRVASSIFRSSSLPMLGILNTCICSLLNRHAVAAPL